MAYYLLFVMALFLSRAGFGVRRIFFNKKPRKITYYNEKADATEVVLNVLLAALAVAMYFGNDLNLI